MIRSVLSNWGGLVFGGVVSFLLTPMLINHLGLAYFGMWVLASSVLDYYGLLDVGIRTAMFRFVAKYKGAEDQEALHGVLNTSMALALAMSSIFIVLIPVVVIYLPHFFSITGTEKSEFQTVLILMGLSMAFSIPARVLGSYVCGLRRFDLYNLVGISTVALRAILFVIVLLQGRGVVAVAAVTLGVSVVSLLLNLQIQRITDPTAAFDRSRASWGHAKDLTTYGVFAFINVSGESIRSYSDSIVIARVLTLALVAPFSIATRLMEYFKMTMAAIGGPLLGAMSEMDGSSQREKLKACFLKNTRYMSLASLLIAAFLFLDGKEFIRLWLGPSMLSSYGLMTILAAAYVVSLGQYPSQLVAFALNRHRALAFLTLAEGIANIVLSVYWARRYGLVGVAWGTAVPLVIAKIWIQPWYALHTLELSTGRFVQEAMGRPILFCISILLVGSAPFMSPDPSGWVGLLGVGILQALILCTLMLLIGLDSAEQKALFGYLNQKARGYALPIAPLESSGKLGEHAR